MAYFKDFDAFVAEKQGKRPEFRLAGQDFTCRSKIPWERFSGLVIALNAGLASTDEDLKLTKDFFNLVLIKGDRQRFMDLLAEDGEDDEDDENVAGHEQVAALLDWLMDIYVGGKAETTDETPSPEQPTTGGQSKRNSSNTRVKAGV